MSGKRLKSLCVRWQRRLRLQDWKINVKVCGPHDLGEADGKVEYDDTQQTANIYILRGLPDEYAEETLVHELLHLRLSRLSAQNNHDMETAITMLAGSLRDAYADYDWRSKVTRQKRISDWGRKRQGQRQATA